MRRAAGRPRPGIALAMRHAVRPQTLRTVFAGQDREATERAEELERRRTRHARMDAEAGIRNAGPVADRYFTALADFGIEREGRRARLALDEGTVAQARETLRQSGLEPGAEYLAAAAAASSSSSPATSSPAPRRRRPSRSTSPAISCPASVR